MKWVPSSSPVIHDFPYSASSGSDRERKCPHTAIINVTKAGACRHRCPGCYAQHYRGSATDGPRVYRGLAERLDRELKRLEIVPPLYVSAITDCFQLVPEVRALTRDIVRVVCRAGASFYLATKSADIVDLLELPELWPDGLPFPHCSLQVSLEAPAPLDRVTSPGASPVQARLEAMRTFSEAGFRVVARLDPLIIGLVDEDQARALAVEAADAGADHIICSTGTFNRASRAALLQALERSPYAGQVDTVARNYAAWDRDCGAYRLPRARREEFHGALRAFVEGLGLTYAVCQELPRHWDSPTIASCTNCGVLMRRSVTGALQPICSGDCLRSCPDPAHPPCGRPELQTQYPYRISTLRARAEA